MQTRSERPRGPREKKTRRRRRLLVRAAQLAGLVLLLGVGTLTALFVYYGRDLPDVASLSKTYRPRQTTRIVARDGTLLAELFEERRTVVPFDRVPAHVLKAVLAAEDADFYEHRGLDYPGMVRALYVNVREGRFRQGGSTITQQVVKNMLLTPERSVERKVKEVLLARRLEQQLGKDEILFLWLNQVNFGDGRYGIQEASRYYFGKDVQRLSLAEAALLAGIPKAPSHYSPRHRPEAAVRRRAAVLAEMVRKRFIDAAAAEGARAEPVRLATVRAESTGIAPEVVALAKKTLRDVVGEEAARGGGYTVVTTIDAGVQREARARLQEGLRAVDERQGTELSQPESKRGKNKRPARHEPPLSRQMPRVGHTAIGEVVRIDDARRTLEVRIAGVTGIVDLARETRYLPAKVAPSSRVRPGQRLKVTLEARAAGALPARLRLAAGPEGAVVVLDPRTRDVLALVGGYDAAPLGFDRARDAARQPGSAFKPIVYSAALNTRRFSPASILYDTPEIYAEWRPRNYETWEYQGPIRLRDALAQSINMAAVKLLAEVGVDQAIAYAHALGIRSELTSTLALALGASEVRPMEMASAYAVFASGGYAQEPRIIDAIRDSAGREVALAPPRPAERVIGADEAYLITSLLTSVIDGGTGRGARRLGRPAAGKTGTSNDARDAWFVGYTPDLVGCVWVGFDDHSVLGRGESGARTALPIWTDVMLGASRGRRPARFEAPSGVVTARINPASGLLAYEGLAGALDEQFLDGTQPTETARPPDVVDPNAFLVDAAENAAAP